MARTHRSSSASDQIPKYFGKHGIPYENPNKVKKNGAGRHNWGNAMDDVDYVEETGEFSFSNTRRRSNSILMQQGPRVAAMNPDAPVFDDDD